MTAPPPSPSTETRFDVRSADGTLLAVWEDGEGPPLLLVHGSMQEHSALRTFVDHLRNRVTTYAMDRRGFGASGDADPWSLEREFEDVAAVVAAVAASAGEPVAVWGHSYGANCAMGGAARTEGIGHLVLYEPSLGLPYPPGSIEAVERALAAGDHEQVLVQVLEQVLELGPDEIDALRSTPAWPDRVATAPTVPREYWAETTWSYRPGQFDAVTAPTLMLVGSDSPATLGRATDAAAAALGSPRIRVLEGHAHLAHLTDPAMVADVVCEFLGV